MLKAIHFQCDSGLRCGSAGSSGASGKAMGYLE